MRSTATLFHRLLPALLLAGLVFTSSCEGRKDHDPRPKGKCGTPPSTPPPTTGGNN